MSNKVFDIKWERFVKIFIPTFARKPKLNGFAIALIAPLKSLYFRFKDWLVGTEYKLAHTGQVIYLEKVLNEAFAPGYDHQNHQASKSIYIDDGDKIKPPYIFQASENNPLFLPEFIYLESEWQSDYCDFIVKVPASIGFIMSDMVALVDYYKLAGKSYKIEIV